MTANAHECQCCADALEREREGGSQLEDAFVAALSDVERLTVERDHARDVACALEGEVARIADVLRDGQIEAEDAVHMLCAMVLPAEYPGEPRIPWPNVGGDS